MHIVETQIGDEVQEVLCKALEEISIEKQYQEKCLLMLVHALQSYQENISEGRHNSDAKRVYLFSKYQLLVCSVLMATLPRHFPGTYFTIFLLLGFVLLANLEFGLLRIFYTDVSSHKIS